MVEPLGSRGDLPGFRQNLGRSILLGLELLVAGDIVRTVAVAPTLETVLVLALIVLMRTFLSMSLEVELKGRWPWNCGGGPVPSITRKVSPRAGPGKPDRAYP